MKRTGDAPTPLSDLVHAFFDSAIPAVRRLDREPGFGCDRRLQVATARDLVDVTPEQIDGRFFFAAVSFETSMLDGEISYGDRELYINLIVGQRSSRGYGPKYGLWEWANALGQSDERAGGDQLVRDTEHVRRVVDGLGEVLAALSPRIAGAQPEVFAAMEAARIEVRRAHDRDMAKLARAGIASEAADAFRAEDYRRVVRLLGSRDDLTPAERVKLRLARKYQRGQAP